MEKWVVARTKRGAEGIAGANLLRQGFTPYLPRVAEVVTSRAAGKVQSLLIAKALFPGLIFVRIEQRWRALLSTYGTRGVILFGGQPAVVPAGVIKNLQSREDRDGIIQLPKFKPGQEVSIRSGAMANKNGIYEGMDGFSRARVLIEFLGGRHSVLIEEKCLAPA